MYYNAKDVYKILDKIKEKYHISDVYEINNELTMEENEEEFRFQMLSSYWIPKIINDIKNELNNIELPAYDDFSLDIPTKCDNCFAKRSNGICWVCAFTGDLSESGFHEKYGIMENCPFLTKKQIDDLAYDFIQNQFETQYQDIVRNLNTEWTIRIREDIKNRFETRWGDDSD